MSMFKLSCDQYLHQKIKNFSKTNKIFLKNRIFREFFLNAKNSNNTMNDDFGFILKENIITNICNNEFLKKINKKTPYEGVFSECVLE
ncbi:hypothetical protein BLM37_01720 [Candidatus Gracilibacteria bacterium GN02-873]|nr:hypothetical protein BLM37_01720 [Candidatus Gracilibacteria bacterium GN02-873]